MTEQFIKSRAAIAWGPKQPLLVEASFPVTKARSISGHSMGGHGALTIALKNPKLYRSASAFSPIANPVNVPWGKKPLDST